MQRTAKMVGIVGAMLLISGVLAANTPPGRDLAIPLSGYHVIDISYQAPCYAAAALFAAFACLYGFLHLPLINALSRWHFWLSAVGITLYAVGMFLLGSGNDYTHGIVVQPPMSVLVVIAVGLILGPPLFLAAQVLFAINLIRAIFTLARARRTA